jgi:hypothetical protein
MSQRKRTILMYARSRGGKTTLLGELAEYVKLTLGLKTLIYSIDKGGIGPIQPLVDLGVIDLVEQGETDPWIFMNKAATGQVRDGAGKWVPADLKQYGMIGYESLTGFSDAFMQSLAEKAAQGVNIGGAANVNFTVTDGGESLKIGGNNMGHYNVVQTRVLNEVWKSQKNNVPFVVWTASASRDEDPNATGKVIGPQVCGKAMTAEMLRHFDLTFRLDCLPAQSGKPERHILYLGNSVDIAAGNAVGLGNTRVPLIKDNFGKIKELPSTLEPASLVGALDIIEKAEAEAKEAIKRRLEAKK